MRLLDLFAGIGGFSLAAHWMGWETVAFVEKDTFCQKVLRKNFGQDIEIHDDIFEFSGKPFRGRVDIVTGGFPCQPFSSAGRRQGVNDERYLFPETLRVIREVQPAWIVLENVNGLVSMANSSRDVKVGGYPYTRTPDIDNYEAVYTREEIMLLNCIREEIEREGYAVQPIVIPISAVGAPHERKRIWIVAHNTERTGRSGCTSGVEAVTDRNGSYNGLSKPTDSDASDTAESGLSVGGLAGIREFQKENGTGIHDRPQFNNRNVSDAPGVGLQRSVGTDSSEGQKSLIEQLYGCGGELPGWDENWFEVASRLCGVDARIPDRVDRIKSLGNSIGPRVAYEIFKAIEASER